MERKGSIIVDPPILSQCLFLESLARCGVKGAIVQNYCFVVAPPYLMSGGSFRSLPARTCVCFLVDPSSRGFAGQL